MITAFLYNISIDTKHRYHFDRVQGKDGLLCTQCDNATNNIHANTGTKQAIIKSLIRINPAGKTWKNYQAAICWFSADKRRIPK